MKEWRGKSTRMTNALDTCSGPMINFNVSFFSFWKKINKFAKITGHLLCLSQGYHYAEYLRTRARMAGVNDVYLRFDLLLFPNYRL